MSNIPRPTVQEMLVTTCCPLSGFVPEKLMATKSIRDWYNCLFSLRDVRKDGICISVLSAAIKASASPKLEKVYLMVSNNGWSIELTFRFNKALDGVYFCNLVKNSIQGVIVTVRCEFNSWLPGVCDTCSIEGIQDSLHYLCNISNSSRSKSLLKEAKTLLSLATAFSAEPELHEWSCVSGENRGIIDFAFKFNSTIDVLSFIPMVRRILPAT